MSNLAAAIARLGRPALAHVRAVATKSIALGILGATLSCGDLLSADEGFVPRTFSPSGSAKPLPKPTGSGISAKSMLGPKKKESGIRLTSFNDSTDGNSLQWRKRTDTASLPTQEENQLSLDGPSTSNSGGSFAPAPVDDPFGDEETGTVQVREPSSAPLRRGGSSLPVRYQDPAAQPPAEAPAVQEPAPAAATPMIDEPMAQEPMQAGGAYKGVNDCETFMQSLLNHPITDIELSVSPRFNPSELTENSRKEMLDRRIAGAMSRTWTDMQGKVVATGTFVDLTNGSVVIRSDDGSTIRVPYHSLSAGDRAEVCTIWQIPFDCRPIEGVYAQRSWCPQTYTWTASALCHKNLFFEDYTLERYGHTPGPVLEPFRSGAHFFLNIAAMPYKAGVYPPNECRYALGYYRPGDCAPWLGAALPLSARGAVYQTGAAIGIPSILP